jgi:hypothetical protein
MKKSVKIIGGLCAALTITSVALFETIFADCFHTGLKIDSATCSSSCLSQGGTCHMNICEITATPPWCNCECEY